jgi:hypothetical protein
MSNWNELSDVVPANPRFRGDRRGDDAKMEGEQ